MVLTVQGLCDRVFFACQNLGMGDIAPSDVGFIVNAFLQGVIDDPAPMPAVVTEFLQTLADEAAKVTDE